MVIDMSAMDKNIKRKRRDGKYTVGCNGNAGGLNNGGLGWTAAGMERWNNIYNKTAQQRGDDAAKEDGGTEELIKLALLESWSKRSGKPTMEATCIRLDATTGSSNGVMECAPIVIMDDCLSD